MKGGIGLMRKKAPLIATNLTSICCVYKEKIVNPISAGVVENQDMLWGGQFDPPSKSDV